MSLVSLHKKTVWNSSPEELGLTADQLQTEQKWIKAFNEACDALSWEKWQVFWADDAFLKWGHRLYVEGMPALTEHLDSHMIKSFQSFKTEVTCHSFDVSHSLIYQKADLARVVKGDPEAQEILTPVMMVIHKKPGESKMRGLEVFGDMTPLEEKIKAVMGKSPI
ncbi:hypothetical protein FRC12_012451 [Ceratobasidium sp. 428]|nr:hypothetical protein FRC12_012451 [Ceratobasidium sp. 428]